MARVLSPILVLALAACGGSQAATSAETAPTATPASEGSTDPVEVMWHDFLDSSAARDAVIGGDLAAVKPPLQRLAARPHDAQLPPDWTPWVKEMQAEAARGAKAATLAEAAASVAALGTSCGDCHRTTKGGPEWGKDEPGYEAGDSAGLTEKMQRHQWSAEELWLGMTGPVHQAWSRGAAALMNINVPSLVDHRGVPVAEDRTATGEGSLEGKPDPEVPDQQAAAENAHVEDASAIDLDAELRALRELGKRADQASIAKEKQAIYAELLVRCGNCHAKLGIELD